VSRLFFATLLLSTACSNEDESAAETTPDVVRIDPLLLGTISVPGPLPVKVLSASIGMATPTNILHHDYDDSVNGIGCNADHLDSNAVPPDIYPGPAEGGIVTITGYTGGTLLDGTQAPSIITCKRNAMPPSYRCGYGPLDANGEIGPAINATPYPIDANPIVSGDVISFAGTGSDTFGSFPVSGQAPTSAVAAGDVSAHLADVKFDPASDTVIDVTCPDGCSGLATARITATRKNEPKTTSGLIQCITAISPTSARFVIKKEAIRTMRGCNLADGLNCDSSLETVQIALVRFNQPGTSTDSKGNAIQNIAAGQGMSVTVPLAPVL
jgi:hypothetical protein